MSDQDPSDAHTVASPLIISRSETHIVVALELSRAELARHARFLELILDYAVSTGPPRDDWE
jgi:hypothetical protein